MIKYLLGELSGTERSEIEARVFADDDFFAELLAVEDDLVEKYQKGGLSPAELARFERHFLASPKRRARVTAAGGLYRAVKNLPADPAAAAAAQAQRTSDNKLRRLFDNFISSRGIRRFAFAFAALIIVGGAFWLWWQRNILNQEMSRLEQSRAALEKQKEEAERLTGDARQQNRQLAEELRTERLLRSESEEQTVELQRENERLKQLRRENERAPAAPPKTDPAQTPSTIVTFLLTPGLVRDFGEEKILRLSGGARTVVLNLNLQREEYTNYRASLQTAEGRQIWQRDGLKARRSRSGSGLAFPVPARLLPVGVYILSLSGETSAGQSELINQYAFNVVKK